MEQKPKSWFDDMADMFCGGLDQALDCVEHQLDNLPKLIKDNDDRN